MVCWGCDSPKTGKLRRKAGGDIDVYTWTEFLKLGDNVDDAVLTERIENQQPGEACTLIYTSGTTGFPKAVMIRSASSSSLPPSQRGLWI